MKHFFKHAVLYFPFSWCFKQCFKQYNTMQRYAPKQSKSRQTNHRAIQHSKATNEQQGMVKTRTKPKTNTSASTVSFFLHIYYMVFFFYVTLYYIYQQKKKICFQRMQIISLTFFFPLKPSACVLILPICWSSRMLSICSWG